MKAKQVLITVNYPYPQNKNQITLLTPATRIYAQTRAIAGGHFIRHIFCNAQITNFQRVNPILPSSWQPGRLIGESVRLPPMDKASYVGLVCCWSLLLEFFSGFSGKTRKTQICPGLNANEMHVPYDRHHEVSSLIKVHQNTPNSLKYEVIWKCQIIQSNMKYVLNNTCVQS